MERRSYLAAIGSTAAVVASGCLGVLADDYDVGMTPTAFEPMEITVEPGDTVVWKNTSSRGHTVTAYGNVIPDEAAFFATGGFDTEADARDAWNTGGEDGIMPIGGTYSHTFEVPGRHEYFCIPHERESMVGTVIVE